MRQPLFRYFYHIVAIIYNILNHAIRISSAFGHSCNVFKIIFEHSDQLAPNAIIYGCFKALLLQPDSTWRLAVQQKLDTIQEHPKAEEMLISAWFKCKLGPICGENIWKLAGAHSFFYTASPQLGSGYSSKPSKHSDDLKYDRRHNTGVPKSWRNGYCMV